LAFYKLEYFVLIWLWMLVKLLLMNGVSNRYFDMDIMECFFLLLRNSLA